MNQTELFALMREFEACELSRMEWECEFERVVLEKALPLPQTTAPQTTAPQTTAPQTAAPQTAAPQTTAAAENPPVAAGGDAVKAPLVGVFYAASAPDAPAFAPKGTQVKKGQTLCLIEAMKMMNELTSPCDGIVTRVLATDGDVVSFGQVLFEVTPC